MDHRADSIVGSLGDLPAVDGYVVAAPTSLHADIIDALIPSGRPIFTEKPMSNDLERARRIVDTAGNRVFVMDKWRYHPGIERIRQEIAGGAVGDLQGIHIQRWGWGCTHRDVSAIWTLIPHDLSILLHWLGGIPPLRCVQPTLTGRFDGGVIALLREMSGPPITIDMSIAAPEHRRTFTIVGAKATLELRDSYETEIRVRRGAPADLNASSEIIEIGQDMPLLLELQAFLAYLEGGPPPMTSAREALLTVERTAEIQAAALIAARA
jgi:predicted dehydrogenase